MLRKLKNLVVIPTYNEKDNITPLIHKIFSLETPFHVLIVDDGSPDGTATIIKELQETYPDQLFLIEREGKQGLGTAYIRGFRFALDNGYEYIFEMDADFSHNPSDLEKLYRACAEEGNHMAIGSRYVNNLINVINWPISRVIMSYLASLYVRLILGIPINDTTAGFKCYHRSIIEAIDLNKIRFVGYAFQIEMKFLTWKMGFKVKEVPIVFTDRTAGTSKMSNTIFKEAILGVLRMKISSIFKPIRPVNQTE